MTYGLVNWACFVASYSESPSWRPSFKYISSKGSLLGAILCLIAMFLTSVEWALGSFIIMVLIMKYIETRVNKGEIIVHWGTARDAMKMQKAVHAVASLRNTQHHAKTFRPSILVLSKKPREAHHDALFAHSMKKGHGCLIVGHVKIGDPSENVSLHNKDYDAYYQVDPTE